MKKRPRRKNTKSSKNIKDESKVYVIHQDLTPSKKSSNISNRINKSSKAKSESLFSFNDQSFRSKRKYPLGKIAVLSKQRQIGSLTPIDNAHDNLSITMFYKKRNLKGNQNKMDPDDIKQVNSKSYSSLRNQKKDNKEYISLSQKNSTKNENSKFDFMNKDSMNISGKATPGFLMSSSQEQAEVSKGRV